MTDVIIISAIVLAVGLMLYFGLRKPKKSNTPMTTQKEDPKVPTPRVPTPRTTGNIPTV